MGERLYSLMRNVNMFHWHGTDARTRTLTGLPQIRPTDVVAAPAGILRQKSPAERRDAIDIDPASQDLLPSN
jgi:hypothetical protein